MKKIVPDPPRALYIKPGVTHADAVRNAAQYLEKALATIALIPPLIRKKDQDLLQQTIVQMEVSRAMLTIATAPSTERVRI